MFAKFAFDWIVLDIFYIILIENYKTISIMNFQFKNGNSCYLLVSQYKSKDQNVLNSMYHFH